MSDNNIILNIKLGSGEDQLERLEKLSEKPIEVKLKLESNDLIKSLQNSLNQNTFKLKNIEVNTTNVVAQIQKALDDKTFKINKFEVNTNNIVNQINQKVNSEIFNLRNIAVNTTNIVAQIQQALNGANLTVNPQVNIPNNFQGGGQAAAGGGAHYNNVGGSAGFGPNYIGPNVGPYGIQGGGQGGVGSNTAGQGANGNAFDPNYIGPYVSPLLQFHTANAVANSYLGSLLGRTGPVDYSILGGQQEYDNQSVQAYVRSLRQKQIALNLGIQNANAYSNGFQQQSLSQVASFLKAERDAQEEASYRYRMFADQVNAPFEPIDAHQKQLEASDLYQQATADFKDINYGKRIGKAQKAYNASYFNKASDIAEQYAVDESDVLAFGKRKLFDASRLKNSGAIRDIGLGALLGVANGQPLGGTLLQGAGSLAGAAIAPELASIGGAAGLAFYHVISQITEGLKSAAEAGLTFQRSILGIQSTFYQTTVATDKNGNVLSDVDQLEVQKRRATNLQYRARAAFAEVGIGGNTESSILQSVANAFGAKGLNVSDDMLIKLSQGTGAAINLLAPELANNPAVVRRDIFDIFSGLGQAGRTALGSRNPRLVRELSRVATEEDATKVFNDELKKLIDTFRKSDDAVAQMSRFNAQMEQLKSKFGTSFVDNLGPAIKSFTNLLESPDISAAVEDFGDGLGKLVEFITDATAKIIELTGTNRAKKAQNLVNKGDFLGATGELITGYLTNPVGTQQNIDSVLNPKPKADKANKKDPLNDVNIEARPELALGNIITRVGANSLGVEGGEKGATLPDLSELSKGSQAQLAYNTYLFTKEADKLKDPETILASGIVENRLAGLMLNKDNEEFSLKQGIGLDAQVASLRHIRTNDLTNAEFQENSVEQARSNLKLKADQLDLAKHGKAGISVESAGLQYTQALGTLQNAEIELAKTRQKSATDLNVLIDKEGELDKLQAASINRTTFKGQREGLVADLANLQAEKNRLLEASKATGLSDLDKETLKARAAAVDPSIAEKQNEIDLHPIKSVGEATSLTQSAADAAQKLATFGLKLDGVNLSLEKTKNALEDLDKQAQLNALEGEDKAVALIKDYQSKGGVVTNEQFQKLQELTGDTTEAQSLLSEATLGNNLGTENRERSIAKGRLDLFLTQNSKVRRDLNTASERNSLLQQKSSLEFEQRTAPLNFLSSQVQQADALTRLAQLTGGKESPLASAASAAVANLNQFYNKDGTVNTQAIENFKAGNADQAAPANTPNIPASAAIGGKGATSDVSKLNDSLGKLMEALGGLKQSVDTLTSSINDLPGKIDAVFK